VASGERQLLARLDGQVALIIGAGRGIGRATALALSEAYSAPACPTGKERLTPQPHPTPANARRQAGFPAGTPALPEVGDWSPSSPSAHINRICIKCDPHRLAEEPGQNGGFARLPPRRRITLCDRPGQAWMHQNAAQARDDGCLGPG